MTYLTPQEVSAMFENVRNKANLRMVNRDICILMLGFYCGFKNKNIISANIEDIDWNNKCIAIHTTNQKLSYLPVTDNVLFHLRVWLSDRQEHFQVNTSALFVSQKDGRIGSSTLQDIIKKYSVGIAKNVTPQVMRNTCAINLYQSTGDLHLCSQYLNHKNLSTTLKYIEQLIPTTSKQKAATVVENIYSNESSSLNNKIPDLFLTHRIKLVRVERYKNLTFDNIKLVESFWHWQYEKEIKSKYASETFEQWCGHSESELPSYESVFYYKSHFDKHKHLFNLVAEFKKSSQFCNWFSKNLTPSNANSTAAYEITKEQLRHLLGVCHFIKHHAITYKGLDSNGEHIYEVDSNIADKILPMLSIDGEYMYPYKYGYMYAQQVLRAIMDIHKILTTTNFETEAIFITY